ncbi:MAG: sensor domain-containing diguanylate cyclase [Peptococcia bacterium]|jgi:two-component system cell cycle response regulator
MLDKKVDKLASVLKKYFLVFSLLGLVTGLSIYSILSYNSLLKSSWINIAKIRDEQARYLDNWFKERAMIINNIAFSKAVKENDLTEMKAVFKEQLGLTTGFENLGYIDREGNVLLYGQVEYTDVNVADRDYFKEAMRGKSCISELIISRFTNNQVVNVSCPVISDQGEISGVVFAPLRWSKITGIISFYHFDNTVKSYLVDRKGAIFTSSSEVSEEELAIRASVIDMLKNEGKSSGEYQNSQGAQIFGTYKKLDNYVWGLLVEVEKSTVVEKFHQEMWYIILFVFLIYLLLIYPLSRFVAGNIVHPLEQLVKGIIQFVNNCEKETNLQLVEEGLCYEEMAVIKESLGEIGQKFSNMQRLLQSQVFYEPLTGLANKRYFLLRTQEITELAFRKRTPCSLISFSIDNFMQIKEKFGLEFSEKVLVHTADILGETARLGDFLSRTEEERFALILPETDAQEAMQMAELLRKKIMENPVEVGYDSVSFTISVGIATFLGDSEKYENSLDLQEELFAESTKGMLTAQKNGGNTVKFTGL